MEGGAKAFLGFEIRNWRLFRRLEIFYCTSFRRNKGISKGFDKEESGIFGFILDVWARLFLSPVSA